MNFMSAKCIKLSIKPHVTFIEFSPKLVQKAGELTDGR